METTTFTNPATGTSYRLVVTGAVWRITKSQSDGWGVRLAHLRGHDGPGLVDQEAVGRLVAGSSGACRDSAPRSVFARVVLTDVDRTADILTAIAKEAAGVYKAGCPGFRPRSSVLRQQRDRTLATAVAQMRLMAEAWRTSGLAATTMVPDWLAAALEDPAPSMPEPIPGASAPRS